MRMIVARLLHVFCMLFSYEVLACLMSCVRFVCTIFLCFLWCWCDCCTSFLWLVYDLLALCLYEFYSIFVWFSWLSYEACVCLFAWLSYLSNDLCVTCCTTFCVYNCCMICLCVSYDVWIVLWVWCVVFAWLSEFSWDLRVAVARPSCVRFVNNLCMISLCCLWFVCDCCTSVSIVLGFCMIV